MNESNNNPFIPQSSNDNMNHQVQEIPNIIPGVGIQSQPVPMTQPVENVSNQFQPETIPYVQPGGTVNVSAQPIPSIPQENNRDIQPQPMTYAPSIESSNVQHQPIPVVQPVNVGVPSQPTPNVQSPMGQPITVGATTQNTTTSVSSKSRLAALLFCFLLGLFGAHRFYVGKKGTAVLYLLTLGCLGFGILIDLIKIISGSFKDASGNTLVNW